MRGRPARHLGLHSLSRLANSRCRWYFCWVEILSMLAAKELTDFCMMDTSAGFPASSWPPEFTSANLSVAGEVVSPCHHNGWGALAHTFHGQVEVHNLCSPPGHLVIKAEGVRPVNLGNELIPLQPRWAIVSRALHHQKPLLLTFFTIVESTCPVRSSMLENSNCSYSTAL